MRKQSLKALILLWVGGFLAFPHTFADYRFNCSMPVLEFDVVWSCNQEDECHLSGEWAEADLIDSLQRYQNNDTRIQAWLKNVKTSGKFPLKSFNFKQWKWIEDIISEETQKNSTNQNDDEILQFKVGLLNFEQEHGWEETTQLLINNKAEQLYPLTANTLSNTDGQFLPDLFDAKHQTFYFFDKKDIDTEEPSPSSTNSTLLERHFILGCELEKIDHKKDVTRTLEASFQEWNEEFSEMKAWDQVELASELAQLLQAGKSLPNEQWHTAIRLAWSLSSLPQKEQEQVFSFVKQLISAGNIEDTPVFEVYRALLSEALEEVPEGLQNFAIEQIINYFKHIAQNPLTPTATITKPQKVAWEVKSKATAIAVMNELPTPSMQETFFQLEEVKPLTAKQLAALKRQPVFVVAQHFGLDFQKVKHELAQALGISNYQASSKQNLLIKEKLLALIPVIQ